MNTPKKTSPITNFPAGYTWHKRWWSNVIYWISQIPLWPGQGSLSRRDIRKARYMLQEGDILLVGDLHTASSIFIEGIVTHAIAYLGKGRCIHASGHGVSSVSLRKIWRDYDTLMILRPYWRSREQRHGFREILTSQLGKPYDYFFGLEKKEQEAYFCTELINESLGKVDYDTLLFSIREAEDTVDELLDDTFRAHRALSPETMLSGNFAVVFYSDNITETDGRYELKNEHPI